MGSRKDDPGCANLTHVNASDQHKGYPHFYRVNPIIYWSYELVWEVMREIGIPYCQLYEKGYTSIGNMSNTKVNKNLATEGGYRPAYEANGEVERINRIT